MSALNLEVVTGLFRSGQVSKRLQVLKISAINLEVLPDEIILKVFTYLDMRDLIYSGQVSKRLQVISKDESLWQKINLYQKVVPPEFLQKVISNGCKYLSLVNAKLSEDSEGIFNLTKRKSQLKYLELTNFRANSQVFEELMCSCQSLEKFSFSCYDVPYDSYHSLNSKMIESFCIENGKSLQILDLTWCTGLDLISVYLIVDNCVELKELNLEYCNLTEESVTYLVNNLTKKIQKLSLAGLDNVRDDHLEALVNRCKMLKVLDLRGTSVSNIGLRQRYILLSSSFANYT